MPIAVESPNELSASAACGLPNRDWGPPVAPVHLANLLWNMHRTRSPGEIIYPERRVDR
jgi:hypothetical protein